jgi:S-adenosylmethionine uptake transporter
MSTPAFSPALLLIAAIAAGAAMDATIKHLAQTNSVLLVITVRYAIAVLFSLAIWARAGQPRVTGEVWRAHIARGFIIAVSSASFFWAITVLPLVEAVTLTFVYPLVVPFIAHAMLGEHMRLQSVFAAVLGFAGVALSLLGAPSLHQSPLHLYGVIAVIFSALTFAVSIVMMRARAQADGPEIVGVMSSLVPGLILAGPAIALSAPPNLADWAGFLFLGFIAAAFMYLIAHAYARAEAQKLAPLHYTELLWASFYGFVLFHETPRPQIYFGAALIIAACLFNAYDGRRLRQTTAAAAEG